MYLVKFHRSYSLDFFVKLSWNLNSSCKAKKVLGSQKNANIAALHFSAKLTIVLSFLSFLIEGLSAF